MKEKKRIIDLNIECCLETVTYAESNTIFESESPTKLDSQSEKDKEIIDLNIECCLEVVKDGEPNTILELQSLTNDIPGKQLILDFENFVVRLPIAIDNTEGLLIGSDFGENQIVMDFQNSMVYMLSNKRGVTNIATPSVFMAAFSGHSDIIRNIVSSDGCECSLSSSAAIATQGERSSMNSGHEKEQQRLGMSMAKRLAHEVFFLYMVATDVPLDCAKKREISLMFSRRNCPYTDSVRNNVKNLTAGVEFENTNCHSGSYGFEVESNTIRANQYEQYFWRIGSVSSQDIHAYIWQDLVKETWYGLRDGLGLGPSQRDMAWCSLMRRHG
ncbi:hypothetical protein Tco_1203399 [Tanacetum coccineum]